LRLRGRAAGRAFVLALLAGLLTGGLAQADVAPGGPEQLTIGDATRKMRKAVVELDAITDTSRAETIGAAVFAQRLQDVRVLFVGEEHTNGEFHRVQLAAIAALHAAGRKVIVGLEMFPWDPQPALDRWTRGELDESRLLDESRWYEVWSHHFGHYREIFEFARDHRLRMVGLNAPREVVRDVRAKGFDALAPEVRRRMPPQIDTTNAEHRQLVRSYFDADDPLHAKMTPEQQEGVYLAQLTWDASMGWQAGQALSVPADPREIVVVLIGGGHVAYGLGAERQLRSGFKGRTASLIPVTVRSSTKSAMVSASYADFLWGVPQTAQPTLPVLGVSLMGRIGKEPTKVIQIDAGSTADRAGVRVGDVLRELDGAKIDGTASLQRKVGDYRWGDSATLRLEREGQMVTLPLDFRRKPD
jgi:uncharacterized iron-regulated protein